MNLAELLTTLNIQTQPHQRWLILGPEAEIFGPKLPAKVEEDSQWPYLRATQSQFDGLLLVGALSARPDPLVWLQPLLATLPEGVTLVVVDWQADGPLDFGPDLDLRLKRGKLSRLLREAGFSSIEIVVNHPAYYILNAVKGGACPTAHAGEFIAVASLAELPKNGMKQVDLFGDKVVVANTGREIVAFAQACPHAGQPLHKGKLRGRNVVCPLHGYIWNVCTGEPVEPADEDVLPCYQVKVDQESGQVWVALGP
jgi:nitrite reductase (NADH) small subunit